MIPPEMLAALRLGVPVHCDWVYGDNHDNYHPVKIPVVLELTKQDNIKVYRYYGSNNYYDNYFSFYSLEMFLANAAYKNFRFNP